MPLDQSAHNPTEPKISNWHKVFAWSPKTLTNGKTVWLKYVYKRTIIVDWMPPAFPAKKHFNVQYTDLNGVIREKFTKKTGKKG